MTNAEDRGLHQNCVNLALAVVGSSFNGLKAWRLKNAANRDRPATECRAYWEIMNPNSAMLYWMGACGYGRLMVQNAMQELAAEKITGGQGRRKVLNFEEPE